jgi:hypothetical protein
MGLTYARHFGLAFRARAETVRCKAAQGRLVGPRNIARARAARPVHRTAAY